MTTSLTTVQQDALIERMAQVVERMGIAPFVQFLLEANRPISPITGNMLVAASPLLRPLVPVPLDHLGIFLQDDGMVARLQARLSPNAAQNGNEPLSTQK